MEKLSKRRIKIANGELGHSKEVIRKYLKDWEKSGFDVSEFLETPVKILPKKTNKRIFVLEAFSIFTGGVERWIIDFIRYYPDKDIEWRIWTHETSSRSEEILNEMQKMAKVYFGYSKLEEVSKDATLCLACENFRPEFFNGKTIAVCHGENKFYTECMDKLSWCKTRVGVSKSTLACFRDRPAKLIYNGIDLNRCFPTKFDIRDQWGITEDKLVILTIARFSADKRLYLAIEAAQNTPNSVLVMLGRGVMESKLREYANNLGVDYRMVGFQHDIGSYLNIADVFLVTSDQESFCLSGGEAAIAGVPIVATPVGLFTELENFYTVDYKPKGYEIAQTIKQSITDKSNVDFLRNYYLDNFSVNNFVGQWKLLIDRVLSE